MNHAIEARPTDMRLFYRFVRGFFRLFFKLFTRIEVYGLENLPARGPLILLTNHLHFLDPPLVMAVVPLKTTVLVAEKWARRIGINLVFRAVGGVFIERGTADRKALGKIETLLREGAVIGIAPEGTRSPTRALQEGKGGAAFLASRVGALLIPVVAYGQEHVFEELRRLRRARVVVRIGEPFTLTAQEGRSRHEQLHQMTQEIMMRMARLLPPEYRGVYGPLVEAEERARELSQAGGDG